MAIPDTPAGENLSAMLNALKSRDRDIITEYAATYAKPGSVDSVMQSLEEIGPLRFLDIVRSERLRLQFIVEDLALGSHLVGMIEVENTDPPRIAFSLPWTPVPQGATVIGFDIDEATRESVVEDVADRLGRFYVLAEEASQMEEWLRQELATGGYDEITNGWVFVNTLTEQLRAINNDEHLGVVFSPIANGPSTTSPYAIRPIVATRCGFEDVEKLENNVAYVKVYEFGDPARCRPRAEAILIVLADSDAIVFDLTDTIGGNWGMWGMILGYFLDPTQISALHWREPERVQTLLLLALLQGLDFAEKPIYVLTSSRTFSGGEGFAYDLQAADRATIIGEVTRGGSHAIRVERIDERFRMVLPVARVVNPITQTDWEGTGVQPDVVVPADDALAVALELLDQESP